MKTLLKLCLVIICCALIVTSIISCVVDTTELDKLKKELNSSQNEQLDNLFKLEERISHGLKRVKIQEDGHDIWIYQLYQDDIEIRHAEDCQKCKENESKSNISSSGYSW